MTRGGAAETAERGGHSADTLTRVLLPDQADVLRREVHVQDLLPDLKQHSDKSGNGNWHGEGYLNNFEMIQSRINVQGLKRKQ